MHMSTARDRRPGVATFMALVAAGVMMSACAGENLFSLAATGGAGGPDVEITSPTENFTIAIGDSIRIQANVNVPNGGGPVLYRGTYSGTTQDAYTSETANLNGLVVATLDNRLRAVTGQTAGSVYLVVEVTGLGGGIGKDSVKVTITN